MIGLVLWMAMMSQGMSGGIATGGDDWMWQGGVGHAGPSDIPAIQVVDSYLLVCLPNKHPFGCEIGKGDKVPSHRYSCADKSRILLTSEDGKKHCVKF